MLDSELAAATKLFDPLRGDSERNARATTGIFIVESITCETGPRYCAKSAQQWEVVTADVPLSVELASDLQRELLERFLAPSFQSELLALLREYGGPEASYSLEGRGELCCAAQQDILQRYGFEPTPAGLAQALTTLAGMAAQSEQLTKQLFELHASLGLADPWALANQRQCGALLPWSM